MEIRILQEHELPQALQIARGVFDCCLANSIPDPQMRTGFLEYTKQENINSMTAAKTLVIWGAFEQGQMIGMSGMQREGHITMLYVLPVFQRRGCGKELLLTMRKYAGSRYRLANVTLNAMPVWVASYFAKRKFSQIGMMPGACPYVSMQAKTIEEVSYEKKPISTGWFLGTSLAGLAICAAIAVGFMIYYMNGM